MPTSNYLASQQPCIAPIDTRQRLKAYCVGVVMIWKRMTLSAVGLMNTSSTKTFLTRSFLDSAIHDGGVYLDKVEGPTSLCKGDVQG